MYVRRMRIASLTTLVTLAAVVASSSLAGCKKSEFEGEIAMRVTRGSAPPSEMVFEAKGAAVRLDLTAPDGQKSRAIVRAEGKPVLVVDAQKAWMDLDMTKAGASVAEADPNGKPAVEKTGKHETIAGRDCEVWNVKHASGAHTETCIAEGLAAFDFGALLPGAAPPSTGNEVHEKRLFPLRSVEYGADGKETSRMEVVRIEEKKLDASTFEIPAGYTKIDPVHR